MGVAIGLLVLSLVFGLLERRFSALPKRSIWRRGNGCEANHDDPRLRPVMLQWIEVLVGGDLTGYATHRLFHRRPLWRFHAIHHSSESLDWLAAARVHPLNEAISRVLQLIPFFLLGFDPRVVAAAVSLLTFYAIFLHANLRWDFGALRYVIASPRFHRWHHTSANRSDSACTISQYPPVSSRSSPIRSNWG